MFTFIQNTLKDSNARSKASLSVRLCYIKYFRCLVLFVVVWGSGGCDSKRPPASPSDHQVSVVSERSKGEGLDQAAKDMGVNTTLTILEPLNSISRIGRGDTTALSCTGEYCPTARLTYIKLVESSEIATEVGCQLYGESNGSALSNLFDLLDTDYNLSYLLQPDEHEEISLVVFNTLFGWESGLTGNQVGTLYSRFHRGLHQGGVFRVDSSPSGDEVKTEFSGTIIRDGLYMTPPGRFRLGVKTKGVELPLLFHFTEVNGHLVLDERGFNLSEGIISGYFKRESLVYLLNFIHQSCELSDSTSFCESMRFILNQEVDSAVTVLASIVGGFEAQITDEGATSCVGDACNAIGVCFEIEMESVSFD